LLAGGWIRKIDFLFELLNPVLQLSVFVERLALASRQYANPNMALAYVTRAI